MQNRIHIGPQPSRPNGPSAQRPGGNRPAPGPVAASFQDVLQGTLDRPLRFSGHAQERLAAGHRELTVDQIRDLTQAVDRAAHKGARDALVLMRDMAFVVSVANRTVITAVDGPRMKENIFTNIDSAIIL